ncbi:hypothetical protein Ppa06_69250 [Planomonospora parontospora subsp. parontospora]|uniref:Uncharacterized protein n=2 Tax=Planomonospora parontospora TaxID=58119 RepID=A0AA37BNZ7_9ACTN|nr:hypothetical protein [Planomonospora parontospora]GGL00813.1 hypothetical protein GCM10010126_70170 [Planomonospora parontospora]GII13127.1 hypothetical protein Ppa06_69250 [Planomonospora parontospora subsp. parontospora]
MFLREPKDMPPSRRRTERLYDPHARYSLKRGAGWSGDKVHSGVVTTAAGATDVEMLVTAFQEAVRDEVAGGGSRWVDAGRGRRTEPSTHEEYDLGPARGGLCAAAPGGTRPALLG